MPENKIMIKLITLYAKWLSKIEEDQEVFRKMNKKEE